MRLKLFGWFYFGLFEAVGHNEMNGTKEWNELPPTVHKLPM